MKLVQIEITQGHSGVSADDVAKAFGVGGTSTLIAMACDPHHRPTVERYRDDVAWQLWHCRNRGAAHETELWWKILAHVGAVLGTTKFHHDVRVKQAKRERA